MDMRGPAPNRHGTKGATGGMILTTTVGPDRRSHKEESPHLLMATSILPGPNLSSIALPHPPRQYICPGRMAAGASPHGVR
jgi:hypothetical protein